MQPPILLPLWFTLVGCSTPSRELPTDQLQAIAAQLVTRSGAPGAVLAVMRGDTRWVGAAGSQDLAGVTPMPPSATFRAASITKMFTGALVFQDIEAGGLALDTRLARSRPEFPNAAMITVDQLLSHTGGVTPQWFDGPAVQPVVLGDLARVWSPAEVIATIATLAPYGVPGQSGMQYANTDYVLLGDLLAQQDGLPIGDLMQRRIFDPLALSHTSYRFDNPPGLAPSYFELAGAVVDMTQLPASSILSFAGAAGAVHTTADDLLTFAGALLHTDQLVDATSRATMMTPAEPVSYYAHALMRFCPCTTGPNGLVYSGWGHGGNLPGTWSVVVDYPDAELTVVAMINRDVVDGVALTREVFDPTLTAVLAAVAGSE